MKPLEYKGYFGTAELSEEDGVFHGKLDSIRDLVTYESDTATGLVNAFHEAVDDYLNDCKEEGRDPDKPFKGQFNIRTKPEIHRAYAIMAEKQGISLNELISATLTRALTRRTEEAA